MNIVDTFIQYVRTSSGQKRAATVDDYDYDALQAKANETGEKQYVRLSSGASVVVTPKKEKTKYDGNRFRAECW